MLFQNSRINTINLINPEKYLTDNLIIKLNTNDNGSITNHLYYCLFLDLFSSELDSLKFSTDLEISPGFCEMTFSFQWFENNINESEKIAYMLIEKLNIEFIKTHLLKQGKEYLKTLKLRAYENKKSKFNEIHKFINEFYYKQNTEEIIDKIDDEMFLFFWNSVSINLYSNVRLAQIKKFKGDCPIYLVDRPLIKQNNETLVFDKNQDDESNQGLIIGIISTPIKMGSQENIVLQIINGLIGRFPYSRLVDKIREQENLAYYVKSRILNIQGMILITVNSEYPKEVTKQIQEEISKLNEITIKELELIKKSLIQHHSKNQDNIKNEVNLRNQYILSDPTYFENYENIINAISLINVLDTLKKIKLDLIYRY